MCALPARAHLLPAPHPRPYPAMRRAGETPARRPWPPRQIADWPGACDAPRTRLSVHLPASAATHERRRGVGGEARAARPTCTCRRASEPSSMRRSTRDASASQPPNSSRTSRAVPPTAPKCVLATVSCLRTRSMALFSSDDSTSAIGTAVSAAAAPPPPRSPPLVSTGSHSSAAAAFTHQQRKSAPHAQPARLLAPARRAGTAATAPCPLPACPAPQTACKTAPRPACRRERRRPPAPAALASAAPTPPPPWRHGQRCGTAPGARGMGQPQQSSVSTRRSASARATHRGLHLPEPPHVRRRRLKILALPRTRPQPCVAPHHAVLHPVPSNHAPPLQTAHPRCSPSGPVRLPRAAALALRGAAQNPSA